MGGYAMEETGIMVRLPLHHRDPFDLMLAARAIRHNLTIMTADRIFEKYDARVFLL